jgi:hypothetical protein
LGNLKRQDALGARPGGDILGSYVRPKQSRLVGLLSWRLNAHMGKRLSKVGSVIYGGFQTLYFSGPWRPSIHEILLEIRNCLWRIRKLRETNACLLGTFGPTWATLPSGHLLRCDATRARMLDTQEMRTNHPAATIIDVDLFLEGWLAGAKWAADTFRSSHHIEHMGNSAMDILASENVIKQIEALRVSSFKQHPLSASQTSSGRQ